MNSSHSNRTVVLHGYHHSVYVRIVRMTLLEKGVPWRHVEIDPFAETISADYLALNPFGRVPTLVDGDFVLYETAAISRYIDEAFSGPALQPTIAADRARMTQFIAIADSYGYWPLVRQVFSQRVFRPATGVAPDEAAITEGLEKSAKVLAAWESLTARSGFLVGRDLTLADLHLAPMIAYFTAAPEGAAMLVKFPRLSAWWGTMSVRGSLARTDPGLPEH